MSLQITTGPTAEPVTVGDVKLRLNLTSTVDDVKIGQLVTVARVFAETVTCLSLVSKAYQWTRDRFPWPHEPMRLPVPPVSAVSLVEYLDSTLTWQTWDSSEYYVALQQMPALIVPKPGNTYPCPVSMPGVDAVRVTFVAGPASGALAIDLSTVLEGIRQLTVHLYEHPELVTAEPLKEAPLGIMTMLRAKRYHVHH